MQSLSPALMCMQLCGNQPHPSSLFGYRRQQHRHPLQRTPSLTQQAAGKPQVTQTVENAGKHYETHIIDAQPGGGEHLLLKGWL
eukprot:gene8884-biopygen8219